MCRAQSCGSCKYKDCKTFSKCCASYFYDQLVGKGLDKETSASAKPATADKMEAVRLPKCEASGKGTTLKDEPKLPKWVKEGQWVEFAWAKDNRPYKILGVRHRAVHICNMADDEREVYYGECKPVCFRAYRYEEAKELLGKVIECFFDEGPFRGRSEIAMQITRVSHGKDRVLINGESFSSLSKHLNATIDGIPIGVPEVDEEAMKEAEE